ncbi:MAG: hypothetical protein K2V38_14420 [Gemmataceae bacterium]|nr:hypothetical protein [Gemmataceae bacterium]
MASATTSERASLQAEMQAVEEQTRRARESFLELQEFVMQRLPNFDAVLLRDHGRSKERARSLGCEDEFEALYLQLLSGHAGRSLVNNFDVLVELARRLGLKI